MRIGAVREPGKPIRPVADLKVFSRWAALRETSPDLAPIKRWAAGFQLFRRPGGGLGSGSSSACATGSPWVPARHNSRFARRSQTPLRFSGMRLSGPARCLGGDRVVLHSSFSRCSATETFASSQAAWTINRSLSDSRLVQGRVAWGFAGGGRGVEVVMTERLVL